MVHNGKLDFPTANRSLIFESSNDSKFLSARRQQILPR